MLRGDVREPNDEWELVLARDYCEPRHHISLARAVGRRLRRTYAWLLLIQALAYFGKIAIHPTSVESLAQFVDRATIGPLPGWVVLLCGLIFHASWIVFAFVTLRVERVAHGRGHRVSMG